MTRLCEDFARARGRGRLGFIAFMAHHDFWSTRSSVDAQARASTSAPTVQTTPIPEPSPLPSLSATSGAAAAGASRAAPVALILKSSAWKKLLPFRRRGPSTNVPVQRLAWRSGRLQPGVPQRPVLSAQLPFIVPSIEARSERVPRTLLLDVWLFQNQDKPSMQPLPCVSSLPY